MIAIVIYILLTACQVVVSAVFYWRSRNIKQINWLPKFIIALANISGVLHSVLFVETEFFNVTLNTTVEFWRNIIAISTTPVIMGMLIRFQRVQVQLRVQEENTIKTLKIMKRANIMEVIFVFTLLVAKFLFALDKYLVESSSISQSTNLALMITATIFEIVCLSILSHALLDVNKQLGLFFDQVAVGRYAKKSIASLIAAFFVLVIHFDIIKIINYYTEIPMIYFAFSKWMNNLIFQASRLALTGTFLYLADFGFEARTK